jgi:endopolyphosphatase
MNVDHFFFLEAVDLEIFPDKKDMHDGNPTIAVDGSLFQTLLGNFGALPKSPNLTDYAVVNVAPSVVPNPYLPAFRIFSYNISAPGEYLAAEKAKKPKKPSKRKPGHPRGDRGDKKVHCKSEEYQDTWWCHLDEPWYSDPSSPSRSNQRWTPLGYAQYYIPDLGHANKTHTPHFELEYLTYPLDSLHPNPGSAAKRVFQYPVPLRLLPEALREPGVAKSKYAPYRMSDLTIPSWIRLARQVADEKAEKLRKRFRKHMYLGGQEE